MKRIFFILLVALGLQTQAQINICDSVTYTTTSTINYPFIVSGNVSGFSNMIDSISWNWTVCNTTACYTDAGGSAHFSQVSTTDTLKVCYDVVMTNLNGMTYTCTGCDSLIYNHNTYEWEIMRRVAQPVSINEIRYNSINNGKIYDLMGKELNYIPKGKMYIRDNRLCVGK